MLLCLRPAVYGSVYCLFLIKSSLTCAFKPLLCQDVLEECWIHFTFGLRRFLSDAGINFARKAFIRIKCFTCLGCFLFSLNCFVCRLWCRVMTFCKNTEGFFAFYFCVFLVLLHDHSSWDDKLRGHAAFYIISTNLLHTLFPILICLFVFFLVVLKGYL